MKGEDMFFSFISNTLEQLKSLGNRKKHGDSLYAKQNFCIFTAKISCSLYVVQEEEKNRSSLVSKSLPIENIETHNLLINS
ncbi:hypothetical protein GGR21_000700 [Dysgonomonas hofstadii]|uniref:Uncharacterized protein n=1 Tax=Dysgonomonas hofstadii TaxID=637886 RepID=A0A840CSV2_9BACT|nr:hypothetical protein [Dysgonomonas hofstadii]